MHRSRAQPLQHSGSGIGGNTCGPLQIPPPSPVPDPLATQSASGVETRELSTTAAPVLSPGPDSGGGDTPQPSAIPTTVVKSNTVNNELVVLGFIVGDIGSLRVSSTHGEAYITEINTQRFAALERPRARVRTRIDPAHDFSGQGRVLS
jgi:hypothetical protein